jgi:chromosome transmission fidelity protein 18
MSSSILGFHNLFATSLPGHARANDAKKIQDKDAPDAAPYTGPSAPFQVREGLKANNFGISALQTNLSIPLARMYRSKDSIATELLPFVLRFLAPDVKPVIINTSSGKGQKAAPMASVRRQDEKDRVFRAVECMAATGVRFERHRVEDDKLASGGWVYRMEPSLDGLAAFSTLRGKADGVRYAVRSVLEGEWQRRSGKKSSTPGIVEKKAKKEKDDIEALKVDPNVSTLVVKKDFFGRVVKQTVPGPDDKRERAGPITEANRVWVSFHEGYSNAVRRPITVEELMRGL